MLFEKPGLSFMALISCQNPLAELCQGYHESATKWRHRHRYVVLSDLQSLTSVDYHTISKIVYNQPRAFTSLILAAKGITNNLDILCFFLVARDRCRLGYRVHSAFLKLRPGGQHEATSIHCSLPTKTVGSSILFPSTGCAFASLSVMKRLHGSRAPNLWRKLFSNPKP